MTDRVKVHKLVVYVIDHDDYGADEYVTTIEQHRDISGTVIMQGSREIDWNHGECDYNFTDKREAAFERLFNAVAHHSV